MPLMSFYRNVAASELGRGDCFQRLGVLCQRLQEYGCVEGKLYTETGGRTSVYHDNYSYRKSACCFGACVWAVL